MARKLLLGFMPVLLWLLVPGGGPAQTRVRTHVRIPDILGYETLKCDFHIHTVFSDGSVWPDIRSEEAWREGLDCIAITDHIEYLPHKDDLPPKHDRPYEIAREHGNRLQVTVIKGSEITRDMPPGHLNAIFLESAKVLETENWRDAVKAAHVQGAFIFWNHPGWEGQQPDRVARWYPEHTELVESGQLHGIEVANGREYYPAAHRWCMEKNLTMLSSSDIHNPLNLDYHVHEGDHRPVTLVFARDRSPEAVQEALFARRTVVYASHRLIGEERYLREIFIRSIHLEHPAVTLRGRERVVIQVRNDSDLRFELRGKNQFDEMTVSEQVVIPGGKTALLTLQTKPDVPAAQKRFQLSYVVENLKIDPEQGLPVTFDIDVTFVAPGR